MGKRRAAAILRALQRNFAMPTWIQTQQDPFKTLIVAIISQNTADRNTAKAFEHLSKKFEIKPEVLARAKKSQIKECLRVAGLYNSKAKTIIHVSKIILEKFHGSMTTVLSLPLEEARKKLIEIPGIGPKTADVVLLFSAQKPTIPVDTHVNRVTKRLGLAPANADYEIIRNNLQNLYEPKDYLMVHLFLIAHGRRFCRARHPLCNQCPVNIHCPSKGMVNSNAKNH